MTADAPPEVEVWPAAGFELVALSVASLTFLIESLLPCLLLGECLRAEKEIFEKIFILKNWIIKSVFAKLIFL